MTLAGVLGSQSVFAGAGPFDGEDNTFWAGCVLELGQTGECDFFEGDSTFDLTSLEPSWTCELFNDNSNGNGVHSDCEIFVPNFIDPLLLKQFHITTESLEVDAIECFDDFDDICSANNGLFCPENTNHIPTFGSKDSSEPNGELGVIEEWRCEPNPDFEIIFLSFSGGTQISSVDIHTVSKIEPRDVGGEIIPIEATSLILAGAQSFSWMIPLVLSVLGIGLFVVSRKSKNSHV